MPVPSHFPTLSSSALAEQQYPFLFYDRILTEDATHLTSLKCIAQDEWPLAGSARYPFWCFLESMAQSAGVLVQKLQATTVFPNRVLTRVRRARYYHPVSAGDALIIHVRLLKHLERYSAYYVESQCEGKKVGRAEMYFFHF